jgi:3-oxoacyl-[acyl-carrier-protein] synthase II
MRRRVVLTGVGALTAAVTGGSSAVDAFLASSARPAPTATVSDEALAALVAEDEGRRMSRVARLAVAATRLALRDAGIDGGDEVGLVAGTEFGDLRSTLEFAGGFLDGGPGGLSALLFPNTVMNTMAAAATIAVGARQLSLTLNAPTVAGELAVARAASMVAGGRVDAVVAGGVDERDDFREMVLGDLGVGGTRGEGAVFVVLEALDRARERGHRILGEVLGSASGALPARPHGVGRSAASRVIGQAIERAGVEPAAVAWAYVSAGGDAARDGWERRVVDAALGARPAAALAERVGTHAGSGALAVAAAAWTARTGRLPGTSRGPERPLLDEPPGIGLVHGLARGGIHVALVIGPPPPEAG